MKNAFIKDEAGVNVMVEYLITLMITMTLFTLLLLLLNNVLNTSDQIAFKEEFDIVANDMANRISAFSYEEHLNSQSTPGSAATVGDQSTRFDLPQLAQGKQYCITITNGSPVQIKVSSVSNSNIYSMATCRSSLPINQPGSQPLTVYSQPGQYELYYDHNTGTVGFRGVGS